jgi:hypothetical protein
MCSSDFILFFDNKIGERQKGKQGRFWYEKAMLVGRNNWRDWAF